MVLSDWMQCCSAGRCKLIAESFASMSVSQLIKLYGSRVSLSLTIKSNIADVNRTAHVPAVWSRGETRYGWDQRPQQNYVCDYLPQKWTQWRPEGLRCPGMDHFGALSPSPSLSSTAPFFRSRGLRSRPQLWGLGERLKAPQWGLGRFWCIWKT